MKNRKVLILLGISVIALLVGGSFIYSKFIDKPKIDVQVTETSEVEKVEPKNEETEKYDSKEEVTDESAEDDEAEDTTENEDEQDSSDEGIPVSNEDDIVYEQEKQEDKPVKESAVKDAGNGIIKSTYVKVEDTGNSRTYMGVTGGDEDEHFYDFEQFNYFLGLIGEEIPAEKEITHQGDVHTAYYENGMYVSYNSKSDKMIVVKGVQADDEGVN